MKESNFLSLIKDSVIDCIKKDNQFKHIPFIDSVYNLSPNSFNNNKPVMVVGLNEITNLKANGICGKKVTQLLTIEYHTKANSQKDWETTIGIKILQIVSLIDTALKNETLFQEDANLEFVYANTGRFRREENKKDKILSHAGVIQYNLEYDLDEVI